MNLVSTSDNYIYLMLVPYSYHKVWKECLNGSNGFSYSAPYYFLLFWRIYILYSVLVKILLSICEAVVPSCSLQYREKPETTWGDVNLIPRQNMRCGEKRVEIVTFRRGLLKKEVRSFTWLRRSSPRRKERSREVYCSFRK